MLKKTFFIITVLFFVFSCVSPRRYESMATTYTPSNERGTSRDIIDINEGLAPPSKKVDRFFSDNVKTIYVMTFFNESFVTNLEERLFSEILTTIPKVSDLTVSPSPSADALLRGRITTNVVSVITSSLSGEPQFVNERVSIDISLRDNSTGETYKTNVHHYAYYNISGDSVMTEAERLDEFATNMALFVAEICAFGHRKTLYEYGLSNKTGYLEEAQTIQSLFDFNNSEESTDTNEDGVY